MQDLSSNCFEDVGGSDILVESELGEFGKGSEIPKVIFFVGDIEDITFKSFSGVNVI
jgi:hypothetical protein